MSRPTIRRLVLRLVFLGCVLGVHAATMNLLDREDIVGRALGAHGDISPVVVVGLFAFLLLRVFVWVFLPGFVLFWLFDTAADVRSDRAGRQVSSAGTAPLAPGTPVAEPSPGPVEP